MKKLYRHKLFAKTVIALMLTTTGLSTQAKTDMNELANELEIMTSILQTSLRQGEKNSVIKTRSIDVIYLANQGVVFDISTTRGASHFNFEFSSMPTVPPVPPAPTEGFEREWVVEFDNQEWSEVAHESTQHVHEVMEEAREKLRNLQERTRDYNWELRDFERKRRDLEFEMRNADSQRQEDIQQQLNNMDDEIKAVQLKQKESQEFANQLQNEQQQKAAEKAKALNEQVKQFVINFENNVSLALCKYGAGIKALDANENVNFVLSSFANSSTKARQDRIYVFNQNDVQDCVKGKFDAKILLTKAENYTF